MTTPATDARPAVLRTDSERPPGSGPLVVLLGALFMNILDATIVNVAAPRIRADLHASGAQLQLVVSGYVLSYGVLLITGARIGARVGHARVLRIGVLGFTIASAACGLAPSAGTLVAARFVQGVGAAAMMPQVMSLIQRIYQGPARVRALGLYGAVLALGSVLGQVAGGLLIAWDPWGLDWRVVFLVNIPVGLALIVTAARVLPAHEPTTERGMDLLGVVSLGALVGLVTVPLVLGHELGWPTWLRVLLVAAVPLLGVVVLVERRAWKRGGAPILPADVLHTPGFVAGFVIVLLTLATYSGYLLSMSLHLQSGLGLSALHTGLAFVPLSVGFAAGALGIPRLPDGLPLRLVPVGMALAGLAYLALRVATADDRGTGPALWIVLAAIGLGSAFSVTPVMAAALGRIPLTRAADAGGVLTTAFQLGQVIGVATLGSFYLGRVGSGETSANALGQTCWWLAGLELVAIVPAVVLIRAARRSGQGSGRG